MENLNYSNNKCSDFCCTKVENLSVTIGTNKILKDPKTRLSKIVCIKTIKLVLANPIFFENNIIRNIVNWMLGINDKICS